LVLVAASGNENIPESRFPGSDARTICVGGTNREDKRKAVGDTSIEGFWGACYGNSLDVCAPCLEIPTTDRLGALGYSAGDYYDRFNGTSSATPHVAGLAALILSINPNITNETVREIIETTCDKVRTDVYTYTNVGFKINGSWNNETGYGRINAERALAMVCDNGKQQGECCSCTESYLKMPEVCEECIAPASPEWLSKDQCMYWYEKRIVQKVISETGGDFANNPGRLIVQFRLTYEHRLCLLGRQQGGLLFTTSLLPQEEVKIYQNDRYRRTRSETQRMSVHTSFRQTTSALWQNRNTNSESGFTKFLENVRGDGDANASVGGALFPFSFSIDDPITNINIDVNKATNSVHDEFRQTLQTSSQMVEAERSLTISTFEDSEHTQTTARVLKNYNNCRAITYYVRRVNEVYKLTSKVISIEYRIYDGNNFSPWHPIDDFTGFSGAIKQLIIKNAEDLPKIGEEVTTPHSISLPTDGAVYEAELAHCSSCDPERETELQIVLEKAKAESRKLCIEAELLTLEIERRKKLLEQGKLDEFNKPALTT
jgi:Subtilase family